MNDGDFSEYLRRYVRRHPTRGYGGMFIEWAMTDMKPYGCPSYLSHPDHQRILRHRRRRALRREGDSVISGNGVWICLPAIGKAWRGRKCRPVHVDPGGVLITTHKKPQPEPCGVQAASRS